MPEDCDVFPFQLDHVIARKHRGRTSAANLAWSCYSCNAFKGPNLAGHDAASGEVVRLFNPRNDDWPTHFEWHGARLNGLTPIGRVTIDVLRINLRERVEHRAMLIAAKRFSIHESAGG